MRRWAWAHKARIFCPKKNIFYWSVISSKFGQSVPRFSCHSCSWPCWACIYRLLCLGVPLIVSSNQNHGPEFSYLQNGYNCIIVEDRIDEYVRAVLRLGNDPMLQKVLSRGMKESLDLYGTNQMTNNFIDGITKCLYSDYK